MNLRSGKDWRRGKNWGEQQTNTQIYSQDKILKVK